MYLKHIILSGLIFCFLVACIHASMPVEQIRKNLAIIKRFCIKQNPVPQDRLSAVRTGQFWDDRNLACYFSCVLTKSKVIRHGKFNAKAATDQINAYLPDQYRTKSLSLLEACQNEDGIDACTLGLNLAKCLLKADPTYDLIPIE